MSYVYFIQRLDDSRLIKIGMSANVQRRYHQLASRSDVPLSLLGWLDGGREWLLHQEFAEYRVEGEWFRPAPAILDFIERHVVGGQPVAWDDMIQRAKGRGQHIPLRSMFDSNEDAVHSLFANMDRQAVAQVVVDTALGVQSKGHQVVVRHAKVQGEQGILIFIPGFELRDGNLSLVATVAEPEPEPAAV